MSDLTTMVGEFEFRLTCASHPEQYDVYLGETQVGYVRLRGDAVTVSCPDSGGVEMYAALVNGAGSFGSAGERSHHLFAAACEIRKFVKIRDLVGTGKPEEPERPHFVICRDDKGLRYYDGYAAVWGRDANSDDLHVVLVTPDKESIAEEYSKLIPGAFDETLVQEVRIYQI